MPAPRLLAPTFPHGLPLDLNIPVNTLPIDVIVPVYRGLDETRRCLESVLAARQRTPFDLIVINDASPEPELSAWLRALSAQGHIQLLENAANLGFVLTVNRGMALHPERDVVLLNSDTQVANDWLDRIVACAARQPTAGTLTPWSNNATICSYPFEGWEGGVPGTLGLAVLDRLISRSLAGRTIAVPTGVGFCMYIRRSCLEQTGPFDAERFGRGYGEENDFCRRAAALGWQNLLVADVFVFHEGGVSFSDERAALQARAMQRLLEAHPDYLDVVKAWIAQDPAAPLRRVIDEARAACGPAEEAQVIAERPRTLRSAPPSQRAEADERPIQLHIAHGWGGGIERWVLDFCRTDTQRRNLWLRSRSDRHAAAYRLELLEPANGMTPLLEWELTLPIRHTASEHPEYERVLNGLVNRLGIGSILVSSLIGHGLHCLRTGLPTAFVLHDLYPFCPALFAHFSENCRSCDGTRLQACLRSNPHNAFWHNSQGMEWQALRERLPGLLAAAQVKIVAPTQSVRDRWAALLPAVAELPWQQIGHGLAATFCDTLPVAPGATAEEIPDGRLRLVIPGRLSPHKGLSLLERSLPALLAHADVTLLGCGPFGQGFADLPGVSIVADYAHTELSGHVARIAPHAALLLSSLPESFSYTLSEMFALGLPVIATDTGAFAERIVQGVSGLLVAPEPEAIAAAVGRLTTDRTLLLELTRGVRAQAVATAADMVQRYHALLPPLPAADLPTAHPLIDALGATAQLGQRERSAALANQAEAARTQADTLTAQRDSLAVENAQLAARLAAILNSHSWRITWPLRALSGQLQRRPAPPRPGADTPAPIPPSTLPIPSVAERAELRGRVRGWFHLPDRARILLAFGVPAAPAAFLADVERISSGRNDLAFVLGGLAADHPCWQGHGPQVESLVARRKLFFSPSLHDREAFLWAAEAFVPTSPQQLGADLTDVRRVGLPILFDATTAAYRGGPDATAEWVGEAELLERWPFHSQAPCHDHATPA